MTVLRAERTLLLGVVTSAYTPVDLPTQSSVHYVAQ
jgi:hypothetical protein